MQVLNFGNWVVESLFPNLNLEVIDSRDTCSVPEPGRLEFLRQL
jgi:hypothetical protein